MALDNRIAGSRIFHLARVEPDGVLSGSSGASMLWALVAVLFLLWIVGIGLQLTGGFITYLLLLSLAILFLSRLQRDKTAR